MELEAEFRRAAGVLREAEALLITAGAGMGVDSGLPDFRGNEGFWKAYPPIAKLGKSFVEMANPKWFHINPKVGWAFYGHRLNLYRKTSPHRGFTRLLRIAQEKPAGYFVFTSNVDGQFQKAGYDESRIEECHGSIHHFQCSNPCADAVWDASAIDVTVDEEAFEALEPLPRCHLCGGVARPNVLMFGDWSWIGTRTDLQASRLSKWLESVHRQKAPLAVVEVGAGKAVATVRSRSEYLANRHRGRLVRINPRDFDVPGGPHVSLPVGAARGIGGIVDLMEDGG